MNIVTVLFYRIIGRRKKSMSKKMDAKQFIEVLKSAKLEVSPFGTCNSQTCGHVRSKIRQ